MLHDRYGEKDEKSQHTTGDQHHRSDDLGNQALLENRHPITRLPRGNRREGSRIENNCGTSLGTSTWLEAVKTRWIKSSIDPLLPPT